MYLPFHFAWCPLGLSHWLSLRLDVLICSLCCDSRNENNKYSSKHHVLFILQELDYGALYEVRTPHFYVEANKMPTARVNYFVCTVLKDWLSQQIQLL